MHIGDPFVHAAQQRARLENVFDDASAHAFRYAFDLIGNHLHQTQSAIGFQEAISRQFPDLDEHDIERAYQRAIERWSEIYSPGI